MAQAAAVVLAHPYPRRALQEAPMLLEVEPHRRLLEHSPVDLHVLQYLSVAEAVAAHPHLAQAAQGLQGAVAVQLFRPLRRALAESSAVGAELQ